MKPPDDQRPRWSAPTARTRTPKFTPLFHALRRPGVRGSMHPPLPREAGCVARWPLGQPRALGQAWAAARASPARIPGRDRDAALTHSEGADRSSANTGEPRGREASQTARQRSASPRTTRKDPGSGRAARTGIAFFETARVGGALPEETVAALLGERLLSRDQRVHVVLGVRGPPCLAALGQLDRPPRAMGCLRGLMRDDL